MVLRPQSHRLLPAIATLGALLFAGPAAGQTSVAREIDAAHQSANAAVQLGPIVKLADQATLTLGPDHGFVPGAAARQLMRAYGNGADSRLLGVVVPRGASTGKWYLTVAFVPTGFVAPGAIKALRNAPMYDALRDGAMRGNAQRSKLGSGRLDLAGWVDVPVYDEARHAIMFATRVVEMGPRMGDDDTVNLTAFVFGRQGLIELTLVAAEDDYLNLRRHMDRVFNGLAFNPGKMPSDAIGGDEQVRDVVRTVFGGLSNEDVAKADAIAAAEKADADAVEQRIMKADAAQRRSSTLMGLIAASVVALLLGLFTMYRKASYSRQKARDSQSIAIERALRSRGRS